MYAALIVAAVLVVAGLGRLLAAVVEVVVR